MTQEWHRSGVIKKKMGYVFFLKKNFICTKVCEISCGVVRALN